MKNKCPHPDCSVQKSYDHYACGKHWFSLPKLIRDEIYSSYRLFGALSKEWLAADFKAGAFWKAKHERHITEEAKRAPTSGDQGPNPS